MSISDTLNKHGFVELTAWEIRNGRIKPVNTDWDDCSRWLYAFVVDDKVRYVGKATTVLRSRLDGYAYQIGDRVGSRIHDLLDAGERVRIFGAKRSQSTDAELEAEESELIKVLASDWNVHP